VEHKCLVLLSPGVAVASNMNILRDALAAKFVLTFGAPLPGIQKVFLWLQREDPCADQRAWSNRVPPAARRDRASEQEDVSMPCSVAKSQPRDTTFTTSSVCYVSIKRPKLLLRLDYPDEEACGVRQPARHRVPPRHD